MSLRARALLSSAALSVLSALMLSCGSDNSTPGEVGNGSFGYRCTSDRDPACAADPNFANSYLKVMPAAIAVGGTFAVGFLSESPGALDGSATVGAVSAELLDGVRGADVTFVAKKAGFAGILATRGSSVVDLMHIRISPIARVRVDESFTATGSTTSDVASIELGVGAIATLTAVPLGPQNELVAGSLDDLWTTDDPSVAEITTPPASGSITVRGAAPGSATINVKVGAATAAVTVKILDSMAGSGGGGGAGGAGGAGGGS